MRQRPIGRAVAQALGRASRIRGEALVTALQLFVAVDDREAPLEHGGVGRELQTRLDILDRELIQSLRRERRRPVVVSAPVGRVESDRKVALGEGFIVAAEEDISRAEIGVPCRQFAHGARALQSFEGEADALVRMAGLERFCTLREQRVLGTDPAPARRALATIAAGVAARAGTIAGVLTVTGTRSSQ